MTDKAKKLTPNDSARADGVSKSRYNKNLFASYVREWLELYGKEGVITARKNKSGQSEVISEKDEIRLFEAEAELARFGSLFVLNYSTSSMGGIRVACSVHNGGGVHGESRILSSFTLAYILDGRGRYRDEHGYTQALSSGDCILIRPGLKHWYGPDRGTRWNEVFIDFGGSAFDLMLESGFFKSFPPVFRLEPVKYWSEKIRAAAGERNRGESNKMFRELLRLQNLLVDIRSFLFRNIDNDDIWAEHAKNALTPDTTVHEVASLLNLDYASFRKKFRKLVGVPPGRYLTAVKMDEACNLLTESTIRIQDIAEILDYCDQYQFSRQFKKAVGCSPSQYRARLS